MRLLFVALAPPFPPNNGQRVRNWSLLRAIAAEGHSISLVAFADAPGINGDLSPLVPMCDRVRLVPSAWNGRGRLREGASRLKAIFSRLPYGAIKYESREMQHEIGRLLAESNLDAILCDDVYLFRNLPATERKTIFLNKHDFTFVIVRHVLAHTRNPLKLLYGWLEYSKLRRWEKHVCASVDAVLLCSDEDRKLLRQLLPGVTAAVAANVIDVNEYKPKRETDADSILFFGALDYFANCDAAEFLVSKILPEIRKECSGVRLAITGRNPPLSLQQGLAHEPGVTLTGTVPDMRAEIAKSAVCVVPLRIGSGTRLKILEAAAMAKPIVSTRLGAEGLDFVPGEEILIADEPKEFARAVAKLLKDGRLRESMGRAARRRVESRYSIENLRSALREALACPVGSHEPTAREGSALASRQKPAE